MGSPPSLLPILASPCPPGMPVPSGSCRDPQPDLPLPLGCRVLSLAPAPLRSHRPRSLLDPLTEHSLLEVSDEPHGKLSVACLEFPARCQGRI